MSFNKAWQKLKRWLNQLLEHEGMLWVLPLMFFVLLAIDLMVILNGLY